MVLGLVDMFLSVLCVVDSGQFITASYEAIVAELRKIMIDTRAAIVSARTRRRCQDDKKGKGRLFHGALRCEKCVLIDARMTKVFSYQPAALFSMDRSSWDALKSIRRRAIRDDSSLTWQHAMFQNEDRNFCRQVLRSAHA